MSYIAKIEKALSKHGSSGRIITKGQELSLGDAGYDDMDTDNNKGTPTYTDVDILPTKNDTQKLQSISSDLVGKEVVTFLFYSDMDINRVDHNIEFNSNVYSLVDIEKTIYRDELLIYKVIGAN
jgi:hypothetical protein